MSRDREVAAMGGGGCVLAIKCVFVHACVRAHVCASTMLRISSSKRPFLLVTMTTQTSVPALQSPLKPSGRQSQHGQAEEEKGGMEKGGKEGESLKKTGTDSCSVGLKHRLFLAQHTANAHPPTVLHFLMITGQRRRSFLQKPRWFSTNDPDRSHAYPWNPLPARMAHIQSE